MPQIGERRRRPRRAARTLPVDHRPVASSRPADWAAGRLSVPRALGRPGNSVPYARSTP